MRTKLILLYLLPLTWALAQNAITWSKNYGGSSIDRDPRIIATIDGGYLVAGVTYSNDHDVQGFHGGTDIFVLKLNGNGQIQWSRAYGGSGDERCLALDQLSNGDFVLCGSTNSTDGDVGASLGAKDAWVLRLNPLGDIVWESSYGGPLVDELTCLSVEDDGIVFGGHTHVDDNDFWVFKIDDFGSVIWEWKDDKPASQKLKSIVKKSNGGFVCVGEDQTTPPPSGVFPTYPTYSTLMVNISENGNLQSTHEMANSLYGTSVHDVISTDNDNFIIYRSGRTSQISSMNDGHIELLKVDSAGNQIWRRDHYLGSSTTGHSLLKSDNGNFFLADSQLPLIQNFMNDDAVLLKFNSSGSLIESTRFWGSDLDAFSQVIESHDGGLLLVGISNSSDGDVGDNYGSYDIWVVKLGELKGELSGNVFYDRDLNCSFDSLDIPMENAVVKSIGISTGLVKYANIASDGSYHLLLDTVPQLVYLENIPDYFYPSLCTQDSVIVGLSGGNLMDTLNFALDALVSCPQLSVDLGTNYLRRCMPSNYIVSYKNTGSTQATNVELQVDLSEDLIIDATSIPWTTRNGNLLTFHIGDLGVFEEGSLTIHVTVNCDSSFIGQVLCSEAMIVSDTNCNIASSANWAEVETFAKCHGMDSVEFRLLNTTSNDMTEALQFVIYDDGRYFDDSTILLSSGEELALRVPVIGLTQEIRVEQPSNHPFRTFSAAKVSLCNRGKYTHPGPIEDVASTIFPDDDELQHVAIDCETVVGAYDPNDKQVEPIGFGSNHIISKNQCLSYKVRFQNTGNDTAFNVYIIDTISNYLDISSLVPGASSHYYTFEILDDRAVKFSFDNILLPDSFVNEAASNGFVQYEIQQKEDNSPNTKIRNFADIFFDFNAPIRTNTTSNMIGEITLDTVIYTPAIGSNLNYNLIVYPNPSNDFVSFEFNQLAEYMELQLFLANGKRVYFEVYNDIEHIQIPIDIFDGGMYFYKVNIDGQNPILGKLIFK